MENLSPSGSDDVASVCSVFCQMSFCVSTVRKQHEQLCTAPTNRQCSFTVSRYYSHVQSIQRTAMMMNAVVISIQRCSSGGEINVNPQRAIMSKHTHQHTEEKRIPMTPHSSSLFVCKDCGKSVCFYSSDLQDKYSSAGSYISVAGTHTSSLCTPDKAGVYAATVNLKTCSL